MFGVPIEEAANLFVDNQSVVINATTPTSTLKKKYNAIAYHKVQEAIAAGIARVAKVSVKKNLADLLTKPLGKGNFISLIWNILFFPNAFGEYYGSS